MTDTTEVAEPAATSFLDRLGPRAERRMTPRVSITLAGAGGLIAIGGAIGIGGDQLTTSDGDLRRAPGVAIAVLLIAAGMFILTRIRSGPIATAASTAVAAGIPTLILFVTVDDGDFPPFSFDALLLVSTIVWLAAYAIGPGRGRMVFLALALVFAPIFVMEQVEEISKVPESIGQSFGAMFGGSSSESFGSGFEVDEDGNVISTDDGSFDGGIDEDFSQPPAPDFPDPTNLGVIALVFGMAYAGASFLLSRRGYDGTATPLASIGAVAQLFGVLFLADDLREVGSGLFLVAFGLVVMSVGAAAARRFTSWFGGLLVGAGVLTLVTKALGDDASALTASVVFLLVGIAVVCAAHLLCNVLGELGEEDQRRSFRPQARQEPGTSPAPIEIDLEDET